MNAESQTTSRPLMVAVVGDARIEPESTEASVAAELGGRLMDGGFRLITGGLGGVMEAACRGARSSRAWKDGAIV